LKKNYRQNIESGIKKTTLLSSTIIIITVATVIGTILIKTEYDNFKTHIKNFKNTLIEREKFYIKTTVENLKNDIEFEKLSLINSKKQRIRNQSIIAYNLAYSLYEKTKNLTQEDQISLIKSSIKQISKKKDDINYFVLDTKGNLLLNTQSPKDEGMNFIDFEDKNGIKFINKMIKADKIRQNYLEYYWLKPNKRITYSRHLTELGLIIGSSSFLGNEKDELKDKLLKKIILQRFDKDEFLFIYKINSLNAIKSKSSLLIERNISLKQTELEAMEKLMIGSNYKGNDYIFYENNQKIIYGTFLKQFRYFVGFGTKLGNIYDIVQREKEISLNNMYSKIIKLMIIISLMTAIFFIFSLLFTKKIEKIFKEYKKNVILNEERYHLLFNHSNDAFIISKLTPVGTNIISTNETALKVTSYDENELLEMDFFTLFFDLKPKQVLEKGSLFKTVKLKNKNGQIRTIELNTIIYTYEQEQLLFASLRDITERTLLKEEKSKQENILIQKSKMAAMGEMIGNIAHQWRQPLSQVSGLFFDIESAYDYKELDKKYLSQRIDEANDIIEYMSKTIDDFRNFFNPNSKKEEFLIITAITNALNIVNSTLKYHNINIEIACDIEYKIYGYKNEYAQAIVNIVSNAKDILIDRKVKDPKIKIYIDESSDKPILCIEDNGGGVEEDIINKVFEPYFTTKRDYGTGIGLYMTKLIIEEKMNGFISVKNTNNGALFSLKV
jgi:PAS domain S-box-containing protein